tara:strand:- start:92622 stop:92936 length:315 start_codon:yes stop_codon:yes gene_type:complete
MRHHFARKKVGIYANPSRQDPTFLANRQLRPATIAQTHRVKHKSMNNSYPIWITTTVLRSSPHLIEYRGAICHLLDKLFIAAALTVALLDVAYIPGNPPILDAC